ncbi:hypothetical protein POM88_005964 [Heracleum sosnowskyi]|uniref:Endonuclease/exonuclease/phosphatase domain-containing protein n=1 Tax=Heracleum sosnowskyi TaxID=360622 RepID=A0AAD8J4I8_9APIA|nr:hypothetical protein POM88_005964 [Heracleum sosnowskyi]
MEIRLDRALINTRFFNLFQEAKLTNIELTTSDHCPIFLEPATKHNFVYTRRFKFENSWLREPLCRHIVEDCWRNNAGQSWQIKVEDCSNKLAKLWREITERFKDRINRSKRIIKMVKGRINEASMQQRSMQQRRVGG